VARPGDVLVDLCCGCGAIAAAVSATVPDVQVHCVDIAADAVRCARRNVRGQVTCGDLYDALPAELQGRVAVLTGNAPYVPTRALVTMPVEARRYEPPIALDGGADGLDVLERIVAGAPAWLAPGGRLFVEASSAQAPVLAGRVRSAGLDPEVRSEDETGATIVVGRAG
jgi:release factor glutamine methyltransferase